MKKLLIYVISFIFSLQSFSQTTNSFYSLAKQIKKLAAEEKTDSAISLINNLKNNQKEDSKSLILQSLLYLEIYENKLPGRKDLMLLDNAYRNLYKARVLDNSMRMEQPITELMIRISSHYLYQGVYDFNKRKYKTALKEFLTAENINKQPFINLEDTMLYFSIGQAALRANDTTTAAKYLSLAFEKGYTSPGTAMDLYDSYQHLNKPDSALYFLKKGFLLFPKNKNILNTLANQYLKNNDYLNAKIVLDTLVKIDSSDKILSAYASVCFVLKDYNCAEKYYKKVLVNNPNNQDALYNLGLLYYTKAINIIKNSPDKKTVKTVKPILKNSERYLLKFLETEQDNKPVIKILESIYKLLGKKGKAKKMKKLLDTKA